MLDILRVMLMLDVSHDCWILMLDVSHDCLILMLDVSHDCLILCWYTMFGHKEF